MTNTITTEENQTYKVGKIISANDFKITCKGCKGKFNNFVRYCLTPDSMKWNCQNCSSDFSMYASDFNLKNETTVKIAVFHKRNGENKHKEYGLIDNADFRLLEEVENENN